MRVLRTVLVMAAVAVMCGGASAGASPSLRGVAGARASVADHVLIRPGVIHVAGATGQPRTTSECKKTFGVSCYQPAQIQRAYNLAPLFASGTDGRGETIVIVDCYGSPTLAHDLAVFDRTFGLPAPPSLRVIEPAGPVAPYKPNSNRAGWAGETELDVEYSHVMAPHANILVVATPTVENEGQTGFPAIIKAEKYVVNHHLGGVISQSFSATEQSFANAGVLRSLRAAYVDAFHHHVSVLTASGDSGAADVGFDGFTYYTFPVTSWPDSDPLVTGVGGTQLHLNSAGNRIAPDSVWNDSFSVATNRFIYGDRGPNPLAGGGGKSVVFGRPWYQNGVQSVVGGQRGVPDIAMSGACNGGVDMYQSFRGQPAGWYVTCGTSESTPLMAGVVALADQYAGHPLGLLNPALYAMSRAGAPGIVDVTSGNNSVAFPQGGKLHRVAGFPALPGYDLASGVGTIDAARFVPELARAAG
jgi:subtilase family serine protease